MLQRHEDEVRVRAPLGPLAPVQGRPDPLRSPGKLSRRLRVVCEQHHTCLHPHAEMSHHQSTEAYAAMPLTCFPALCLSRSVTDQSTSSSFFLQSYSCCHLMKVAVVPLVIIISIMTLIVNTP